MKQTLKSLAFAALATALMASFAPSKASAQMRDGDMMPDMTGWSEASQKAAKEQMAMYGKPTEMTPTMAMWKGNGPWMMTIITAKSDVHKFPKEHMDCMEQFVMYRVPPEKGNELAEFDGSVNYDRTQGTLSARCDKEENNILALKLAHDVVMSKKTVKQARKAYGEAIQMAMAGNKPDIMKRLMFEPMKSGAADPDVMTIK